MQLAEDALQEALVTAIQQARAGKSPDNPRAWLYRVAMNKALDSKRGQTVRQQKQAQIIIHSELNQPQHDPEQQAGIPDERLRMIFTCCHPAIESPSQLALTLRALCGLTTAEIARAFLVPKSTMAQRLVRTKRKIRDAGIPYEIPTGADLQPRVGSVLGVIYLIFNEGYSAYSGDDSIRGDLCNEAIYLANCLNQLLPNNAEILGLLALLYLHDARKAARLDEKGHIVMLPQQNRALWEDAKIRRGMDYLIQASQQKNTGPYQLQAAISAVHAQSKVTGNTNWSSIVALYDQLIAFISSDVVALNRAAAISFAHGAEAGLSELQSLNENGSLDIYQPYHATKADILHRLQRYDDARMAYQQATSLSHNAQEKAYLQKQLALCEAQRIANC